MTIPSTVAQDGPAAVFHRLHESGCFVMPNPWDVGSAGPWSSLASRRWRRRVRGSRGRSVAGTPGHARPGARAPERGRGCRLRAGERRLPGRPRRRSGRRGRQRQRAPPRPGSPGSRSRTPRATRPIRSSSSSWPSSGSPPRARRSTRAGPASSSPGVPRGSWSGGPTSTRRVRRLRAYADAGADCLYAPRHQRPGARHGHRRGGRAEAGQPADQRAVHHRRGGGRRSAYAGSASGARSPAWPGVGSCRRPGRSPTTGRSRASRTCPTSRGCSASELNRRLAEGDLGPLCRRPGLPRVPSPRVLAPDLEELRCVEVLPSCWCGGSLPRLWRACLRRPPPRPGSPR